jgi:hypothetical protein
MSSGLVSAFALARSMVEIVAVNRKAEVSRRK